MDKVIKYINKKLLLNKWNNYRNYVIIILIERNRFSHKDEKYNNIVLKTPKKITLTFIINFVGSIT